MWHLFSVAKFELTGVLDPIQVSEKLLAPKELLAAKEISHLQCRNMQHPTLVQKFSRLQFSSYRDILFPHCPNMTVLFFYPPLLEESTKSVVQIDNPRVAPTKADSNSELVSKADARVQEPKEGEIVRVVPRPTGLENMISDEMKQLSQLPEALNTACCCKDYKNSTVILPILP
ncbi:hypothetical protein CQW23_34588 [Capsicum baccatum]|uniref:Uncharacterized protein n=1 Tax=Capsicum baccatum TaxID=33114 RepID=A0A2G2UYJ6_CAPBA|nr:hypothetical protein CQW23_34588 [Capsicum baccatum]